MSVLLTNKTSSKQFLSIKIPHQQKGYSIEVGPNGSTTLTDEEFSNISGVDTAGAAFLATFSKTISADSNIDTATDVAAAQASSLALKALKVALPALPADAVVTAVADAVASVAADSAVTAVADAPVQGVGYVQADVQAIADLANDLKAKYNLAVTLINDLKSKQTAIVALENDLKAKYNVAATLATAEKVKLTAMNA